jgi:hypothetical protein
MMVDTIQIGGKAFDPATVQAMIDAGLLGSGAKHDTSSTTPNAAPLNGPFPGNANQYGLWSQPGGMPNVWNATPRVRSFASAIPMYKSVIRQELIDIATGITQAGGFTNQTSACVVGPKPGQLKGIRIANTFGIIHASTKIFDITKAGARKNRADVPREMYNRAMIENSWLPQVPGIDGEGNVATVLRAELLALGANLERDISKVHFLGTAGLSDNTYFGVATQWAGLDALVKTGYADLAAGSAPAPAADSTVVSFNAEMDGGVDIYNRTIVGALIDTYYSMVDYMSRIGVVPNYALVMRPDMFRALAQVWSCSYSTTRCTSSAAGQPLVRDAVSVRSEYEQMLAGNYLPMEGTNVPVLLDDSIARVGVGNGHYNSDIYGLALTGNGIPVIYGEYFDQENPEAMEIVNAFGGAAGSVTGTANNGMYRVFSRVTGGCVEFDFWAEARLLTTAPFMHFRFDDVRYKSAWNQHDATPGSSYYSNGGFTHRLA